MADTKFTLAQREAGCEKLAKALTGAGYTTEVLVEQGKTELYDSARVRISDAKGNPVLDLGINGKGFVNLAYVYTKGDQSITPTVAAIVSGLVGTEVKQTQYTKVKQAPGGTPFLQE